jgi:flagella synthesis protein FlgN
MTQTALTQETLQQHIGQDISACRNLLQLLEQEREALKARDVEKLETVIQNKSANLLHLEQSARQRSAWVAKQQKPSEKAETVWQTLISTTKPDAQREWEEFRALLRECQEQNEINGKLLARNQQVFARLLAIVRGRDENDPLYNAKGGRGAGYNFQKLGEA